MFSIDGLVSGLDTTSVIEGLVELQEAQVDRLDLQRFEIQTQQSAFQGIESRVLSLQTRMTSLNRTSNSVFDQTSGVSSDESVLTVDAGSNASEGSFSVRVNSLAKAHQIGSQGFDDRSSKISTGEISFQVGDLPATSITIDDTNNTVSGLVDAINTQSDDISASIIFDQANGVNRILLTSQHTGASNQIVVDNNLAATSDSQTQPDFSGLAIQEATNAQIQLGSGAGAIVAEYDSNQVEGLIENVTLNLATADPDKEINISVTRDTAVATEAIEDFVEEYNSLITYIDTQTQFDAETNEGSPLLGNRFVSDIKNTLGALVTGTVPGTGSTLNRFSQIGIDINFEGKLTINSEELNSALSGDIEGIDPSDVGRLFGLSGQSTNSGISFLLGNEQTVETSAGYQVDITQAAERAVVQSTNDLADSIVIDETNNQFQLTIDGLESDVIELAAGTYSQQELASHLESRINNSANLGSSEINVSINGGKLEIESERFGSNSEVADLAGTALATLGFTGSESDQGVDVAGNFIVDGVIEAATGSGRILIGDSDNEATADLQIRVTLDSTQVEEGVESTLTISRGISSRLDKYFSDILDEEIGTLAVVSEDFDLQVESLEASIARVNAVSEAKTEFLIAQFTALETTLSGLQSTASFLTSQLG